MAQLGIAVSPGDRSNQMLYNEPSPLETRVLSKRFGLPNSHTLDTYLATGGYQAFLKARQMTPEQRRRVIQRAPPPRASVPHLSGQRHTPR